MEGLSPGAEFYTNLESMIESRKRYLDFNEAHTKRELEAQQMLNDCFVKHEKMISWLWNHVSDLHLDISSLQEERHSSSAGRTIPTSAPQEPTPRLHIPEPSMIPETPPDQLPASELQIPSLAQRQMPEEEVQNAEPHRVLVTETTSKDPHLSKNISDSYLPPHYEPALDYYPHNEKHPQPGISFSQRLFERRKDGVCDGDATAVKKSPDNDSDKSVLSSDSTQPPNKPAPENGANTPGALSSKKKNPNGDDLSGKNHSMFLPGSAVTPFKQVQRIGSSSRPRTDLLPTPKEEPFIIADIGTENEDISTGRLKKKRKKRKRPRLQLEELEPEAEQTMDQIQDSEGEATEGDMTARKRRLSFVTPKARSREESVYELEPIGKRYGFTGEGKSSLHDPRSETVEQRKRLAFSTKSGMPSASAAPATDAKDLVGKKVANSNNLESKTLRIDGFNTPEAADRAARAIQANFRRKEDCAAIETVRGNARKGLIGYSCHLCEGFLRAAAAGHPDPDAEYQRLVDAGCKHRAKKPPPATPPNYWKVTFDETQTQPPKGPPTGFS